MLMDSLFYTLNIFKFNIRKRFFRQFRWPGHLVNRNSLECLKYLDQVFLMGENIKWAVLSIVNQGIYELYLCFVHCIRSNSDWYKELLISAE